MQPAFKTFSLEYIYTEKWSKDLKMIFAQRSIVFVSYFMMRAHN